MHRRPLCILCVALMISLWILKLCGAPVFHVPRMSGSLRGQLAEGMQVKITGQITSRQQKTNSTQYILSNSAVSFGDEEIHFYRILVTVTGKTQIINEEEHHNPGQETDGGALPLGSCVLFSGRLQATQRAGNPGQFDAREYYGCQGIWYTLFAETAVLKKHGEAPLWYRLREALCALRERLENVIFSCMSDAEAGVLCAMLLGDRDVLEEGILGGFQAGGIMHVLAISGMHITMVGMMAERAALLFAWLVRRRMGRAEQVFSAAVSFVLLVLYGILCGLPVSAVRAILMFAVLLIAKLTRRSYDLLCALALAGILILLTEPGYLFSAGFQLSFLAVAGAAVVYPSLRRLLPEREAKEKRRRPAISRGLLRSVLSWTAINLLTIPLTARYWFEIPLLSLPVNLLILPGLGLVMGMGMAGAAAAMLWPAAGRVLLFPAGLLLKIWIWITGQVRRIPGAVWVCGQPSLWRVLICYVLLAAALLLIRERRETPALVEEKKCKDKGKDKSKDKSKDKRIRCCFAAGLTALAFGILLYAGRAELTLTMLDVGQGDGLVLQTEDGRAFLVDGGSSDVREVGTYRILPYLKAKGIRRIEAIFVTHDDADHFSGIEDILKGIADGSARVRAESLCMPCWMEGTAAGKTLAREARAAGLSVRTLQAGDAVCCGSTEILVLYPGEKTALTGNDGSLVLEVRREGFSALLTGDLEEAGEQQIFREVKKVSCLKAGHHGSSTSTTPALLELTSPALALISCGKGNSYGHPHRETLERLQKAGCDIYRTDRCGAVTVTVKDEKRYTAEVWRKEEAYPAGAGWPK